MINWYEDKKIKIEFDKIPKTTLLFPIPNMSKEEIQQIKEKPFINLQTLNIKITDKRKCLKEYDIVIEKGYRWDGASIPRIFWHLIGTKTQPEFQIASMLHDKLCENHKLINNDRYLSTLVLIGCMKSAEVCAFKRWLIKHTVDNYQKFCGWVEDKTSKYFKCDNFTEPMKENTEDVNKL